MRTFKASYVSNLKITFEGQMFKWSLYQDINLNLCSLLSNLKCYWRNSSGCFSINEALSSKIFYLTSLWKSQSDSIYTAKRQIHASPNIDVKVCMLISHWSKLLRMSFAFYRTFSIFNFYGLFWNFYGFIDFFLILKMDKSIFKIRKKSINP